MRRPFTARPCQLLHTTALGCIPLPATTGIFPQSCHGRHHSVQALACKAVHLPTGLVQVTALGVYHARLIVWTKDTVPQALWKVECNFACKGAVSHTAHWPCAAVCRLAFTVGIIPSLNIAAGLLGFVTVKSFTALMMKLNWSKTPFTQQENTVVQTTVVAAYSLAFSGANCSTVQLS